MVKKSKRDVLLRRKSLQRRKSLLVQKSRRNIRFIKRGGQEIGSQQVEEMLNELTSVREEQGDLPPVKSQKKIGLTDAELSKLNPSQLMDYLREMRKDKKPEDLWVEMGFKGMKRTVSNYTDDVIRILLRDYDINSLKLLFMNNVHKLNLPMIRKYLPDSMWASFGGVDNFKNWLYQKVDPELRKEPEMSTISKPPITKDTFPTIIRQLKKKYPDVNMSDDTVRDLILTDLFKKIYYLNYTNTPKGVQLGGGLTDEVKFLALGTGFIFLTFVIFGFILMTWPYLLVGGLIYGAYTIHIYNLEKEDTERLNRNIGAPAESHAEMKREEFELELQKMNPNESVTHYNQEYRDAYKNFRLRQLEAQSSTDIQKLRSGNIQDSEIYAVAESEWKGMPAQFKLTKKFTETPEYQDAFIGDKVKKYEIHEAKTLNQLDKAQRKAEKAVSESQSFGF